MSKSSFTFIDLFAGIGGLRRGFESVGGECIFTSEWDKYAQITYRANYPHDKHQLVGDIWEYELEKIPNHDVLLGGFPCQPFSLAGVSKKNSLGRAHGFACEAQGTLFFRVAQIIKEKQPKAFLLENVKNLQSHDRGNTFRVIRDVLENELGYHIDWKIINAKRWVPQHRERIFIVGFREDVGFEWPDEALWPAFGMTKLGGILHENDLCVHPKYTLSDHLWKYLQDYKKKHAEKGNGFGCSVFGPNDTTRTLSARYHKDGSEILIDQGPRKNPRRLTPRECARLMGYPDSFVIPENVSDTQLYRQFGNSVVVPVIEAVAKAMKPYILKKKRVTADSGRLKLVSPIAA